MKVAQSCYGDSSNFAMQKSNNPKLRDKMPTIDILMPVHNAEQTICQAVNSILNQTFKDFKLLIVDDGSTDGTTEKIKRYERLDARVQILRQENLGIVDALNNGLEHCRSPYIARMDADDISAEERLLVQLTFMRNNPEYVAISGAVRHINREGEVVYEYYAPSRDQFDPQYIPAQEPQLIHPFLMVRSSAMIAVGGYRYCHMAEDTDLYWRLSSVGQLGSLPDVLGSYRLHSSSISASSILSGRIMSVSTQLAAISHIRRQRGQKDLSFDKFGMTALRAVRDIGHIVELYTPQLSTEEARYLRAASACKLIELANYRPYKLGMTDAKYVKKNALLAELSLTNENYKSINSSVERIAAKMICYGFIAEALQMLTPRNYAGVFARIFKIIVQRLPVVLSTINKQKGAAS